MSPPSPKDEAPEPVKDTAYWQNIIELAVAEQWAVVRSMPELVAHRDTYPRMTEEQKRMQEADELLLRQPRPPYLGVGHPIPKEYLDENLKKKDVSSNERLRQIVLGQKGALRASKPREQKKAEEKRKKRVQDYSSDDDPGRSALGRAKKAKAKAPLSDAEDPVASSAEAPVASNTEGLVASDADDNTHDAKAESYLDNYYKIGSNPIKFVLGSEDVEEKVRQSIEIDGSADTGKYGWPTEEEIMSLVGIREDDDAEEPPASNSANNSHETGGQAGRDGERGARGAPIAAVASRTSDAMRNKKREKQKRRKVAKKERLRAANRQPEAETSE